MADPDPAEYDESGTETADGDGGGGNFLTNRIGPLPMWGWLVVAGGSFFLFHYLKNRNSGSSVATLPTGSILNGSGVQPTSDTGSSSPTVITPSGLPQTAADQWIQYATQILTQELGYSSPAVNTALQDYASGGGSVNSTDYGIIEAAIKIIGNPPNPLPLPTIAYPTPNPVGNPPQTKQGWVDTIDNYNVIGNIVKVLHPPSGGEVYVTDQGFVYALNGANYYGGTNRGAIGGPIASHITTAYLNPKNGPNGYTLVNANGQTYNFGANIHYAGTPY